MAVGQDPGFDASQKCGWVLSYVRGLGLSKAPTRSNEDIGEAERRRQSFDAVTTTHIINRVYFINALTNAMTSNL